MMLAGGTPETLGGLVKTLRDEGKVGFIRSMTVSSEMRGSTQMTLQVDISPISRPKKTHVPAPAREGTVFVTDE